MNSQNKNETASLDLDLFDQTEKSKFGSGNLAGLVETQAHVLCD